MPSREERASQLAKDILILSRNSLMVRFRFLDRGLGRLVFREAEHVLFGTDGRFLYYDPWVILNRYRADARIITRDLLHSLLHLIFRHPFTGKEVDRELWDIACDAAVEHLIGGLGCDLVTADREREERTVLPLMKADLPMMTAEHIYRWLADRDFSPEDRERLRDIFYGDMHGLWYGLTDPSAAADRDVDLQPVWEEISRRMQAELENFTENANAPLVQHLRALNKKRRSYTAFLRRFGVMGEVIRLSDEEFDNHYYAYGMELYGNIPLIEPLEYREQKQIRDFVIAIDTSGSVEGEIVQSFIQHTYEILMEQESFFTKINLHILQCDDRIRQDAKITSKSDFEDYISGMEILGLGETDFRPVFTRVEELIARGEFTDLKGLLYFTDGKGTFPEKKPPFDTAFVLHTEGYEEVPVPAWAMKLEISEEDIREHRYD